MGTAGTQMSFDTQYISCRHAVNVAGALPDSLRSIKQSISVHVFFKIDRQFRQHYSGNLPGPAGGELP